MNKSLVSIVRYDTPGESVRKAVDLAKGLDHLPVNAKVFIKPNIVFWTREVEFPPWGVITTTRVIEDVIVLLKERGIDDITIGEGMVLADPRDKETPAHAFATLGYKKLQQRYGVQYFNVMDRPFENVDLGDGVEIKFNADIVHSDFVVDLPVMKAHNQTMVSLGIKNLKGTIDRPSRKKCHNADPVKGLHFWIARLADKMPPMLTILDGIYTAERGPGFDGKMHRSNILIASSDVMSADLVGANVLGHDPATVPYLAMAAANRGRPTDLSDIEVVGEKMEAVAAYHEYDFAYTDNDTVCLPGPMAKQGIRGVFYRKFDSTMCTYCSGINGLVLNAIRMSWTGEPFDRIEVLNGKAQRPTPGMKKTILLGKCMYQAHKDNPDIQEMIAIKRCPPQTDDILQALHQAGIHADAGFFENAGKLPGFFMARYEGRPEFDKSLFRVT